MNCVVCDKPIPPERLEALPGATKCVPCVIKGGDVPAKVGHMVYNHKTAGEIEIVSRAQLEEINRMDPRGYYKNTIDKSGE